MHPPTPLQSPDWEFEHFFRFVCFISLFLHLWSNLHPGAHGPSRHSCARLDSSNVPQHEDIGTKNWRCKSEHKVKVHDPSWVIKTCNFEAAVCTPVDLSIPGMDVIIREIPWLQCQALQFTKILPFSAWSGSFQETDPVPHSARHQSQVKRIVRRPWREWPEWPKSRGIPKEPLKTHGYDGIMIHSYNILRMYSKLTCNSPWPPHHTKFQCRAHALSDGLLDFKPEMKSEIGELRVPLLHWD